MRPSLPTPHDQAGGTVPAGAGQCPVHRYMAPLMKRILAGEIDPSFVITHRMALEEAPQYYVMFRNKPDN